MVSFGSILMILASQAALAAGLELGAKSASLTIPSDREGPRVSPLLYGIFFEDINCAADGGLYAEMVRNRSFEDSDKPEHWDFHWTGVANGQLFIDTSLPISPANRRSLKIWIENLNDGKLSRQRRLLGHGGQGRGKLPALVLGTR